jgi:hypothetical protein
LSTNADPSVPVCEYSMPQTAFTITASTTVANPGDYVATVDTAWGAPRTAMQRFEHTAAGWEADVVVERQPFGLGRAFTIDVMYGTSNSEALARMARKVAVDPRRSSAPHRFAHPTYIPTTLTLEALDDALVAESVACSGKWLYRLAIKNAAWGVAATLVYHVIDDLDLGSIDLADGSVYAFTVNRAADVVVRIMYFATYRETPCQTVISHASFAMDVETIAQPEMIAISYINADCAAKSGKFKGSLVIDTPNRLTESLKLRDHDGRQIYYDNYPEGLFDGTFAYSGLATGLYVGTTTMAYKTWTCTASRGFVVNNNAPISDVIDETHTSHGSFTTTCANSNTDSWRQYYRVSLRSEFYNRWMDTVEVKVWNRDAPDQSPASNPLSLSSTTGLHEALAMLTQPGVYIPEIRIRGDDNRQCSFFAPEFVVAEPTFSKDSFVMSVSQYPTCRLSTDGRIVIRYPPHLSVRTFVTRCYALYTDES